MTLRLVFLFTVFMFTDIMYMVYSKTEEKNIYGIITVSFFSVFLTSFGNKENNTNK
jgi:hypothetical protein